MFLETITGIYVTNLQNINLEDIITGYFQFSLEIKVFKTWRTYKYVIREEFQYIVENRMCVFREQGMRNVIAFY